MAAAPLEKAQVLGELRRALAEDLRAVTESQRATHEGATHEESRAENDKDTRGLEASYLARGLAQRVAELQASVAALERLSARLFEEHEAIAAGALVCLEGEDGEVSWYLLAPAGGGRRITSAGIEVRVVTPHSPVGAALLGRRSGDDVDVRTPKGRKEALVRSVC
jgi:transcription elongation GreA/GreB family factor